MEYISSHGPNLKIEIVGNGGHFKNGRPNITIKYCKKS